MLTGNPLAWTEPMNILDELVAKGVAGEVIVAVAKLIADAHQNQERRAKNTERMRAVRTRAHTGVHTETPPPAYTTPPIEKPKKASLSRGTRLPIDWQPDDDDRTYAGDLGLSWKGILADFSDYWHARAGPGAVKMDWKATWRRWCRTANERKGGQNGNGRGRPAPKDDPRSIRGALDRLLEKVNGPDEAGDLPREADLRVIPGGRRE